MVLGITGKTATVTFGVAIVGENVSSLTSKATNVAFGIAIVVKDVVANKFIRLASHGEGPFAVEIFVAVAVRFY